MGFILKLIFVYFLIKFLWSLFRVSIIKKLNKKIVKEMNNAMKNQRTRYGQNGEDGPENTYDRRQSSSSDKANTFEADYKVLKK